MIGLEAREAKDLIGAQRELLEIASKGGIVPSWPPEETPSPQEKWWEKEISVQPTPWSFESPRLPHIKVIEIGGLPQAGKSFLEDELYERIKPSVEKAGWYLEVWGEQFGGNEFVVWDNYPALLIAQILPEDDGLFPIIFGRDEVDWYVLYSRQIYKILYWQERFDSLKKRGFENPNQPILVLGHRGPIDGIIWQYALFSHQEDPRFTTPDLFRTDNLWIPYVANQLILSKQIEAIVLMGLSQEEACRRRQEAGKQYQGLTETAIFQTYSDWMGQWIETILPKVHEVNGTGVLVVNGEAPPEENLDRLSDYIKEIVGLI